VGKVEKPAETKPMEKGVERPKEQKSPSEKTGKQPELKPQEKTIEIPKGKAPQLGIERPKEDRKPIELEREKAREKSTPGQGSAPVREREVQKPSEQRRPESERQIQKEVRPERGIEKTQEIKPPVKEIDKPRQTAPQGSQGVKSPDVGSRREIPHPGKEQKPDRESK
jgi:hypothetical protein